MIQEFSLGGWPAVVLSDNQHEGQAERMVTNWALERLERELSAMGDWPAVTIGYNLLAVQTPEGWVLMDGGQGTLTGREGQLVSALAEAGLTPEDVTLIFISHAHADHYGSLVDPDTGALVFPNAHYVMNAAEWAYWTSDDKLNEFKSGGSIYYQVLVERLLPLRPRLRLCDPGDVIAPGMTAVDAPGHTPGHLALLAENGGDKVLYIGDAAVHPIHLKYPDAAFFNDSLPEQSPGTRRALMRLSRESGARLLACHFVFPGFFNVPAEWPLSE